MAVNDSLIEALRQQERELVEALAQVRAALAAMQPNPRQAPAKSVHVRRRQREMREGSTNSYILALMQEHSDRAWDAASVVQAIKERGWSTTAKDPEHSIRSALYMLCRAGKLTHAGTPGQYQWPDKSFGPAAVTAGPREAGEDASNQAAVQTETETLKLPA